MSTPALLDPARPIDRAGEAPADRPPGAAAPPKPGAFAERDRPRPLLIGVPCYRRPDLAERVVASLVAVADEVRAANGEVVLYDDSPEDPALAAALERLLPAAREALAVRVERNPANLGFVRTANRALEEATRRGMDALLLNSDTVVTPGALTEMVRVSRHDPMIGFVNPRSNNATLASLPCQQRFRELPVEAARAAWARIAPVLPPVSYAPTANGFCMLIRHLVLAEFGGFDEVFEEGYNEENDLAMRAGRRGYRAVLANHAFVWHESEGSFGLDGRREALEQRNRARLSARYPEYDRLIHSYFDSPEQKAETLLGALAPDAAGRLDVALDFSSFVAAHNGTFFAGEQLLKAAVERWSDRFNVFVLCAEDTYAFHGYGRYGAPRRDPHGPEIYAAVFRVGQPYDWGALHRLTAKAAVFGVFMLDTISMDSSALADDGVRGLWTFTLRHADLVAATSRLTYDQLTRRFPIDGGVLRVQSLHSLDLDDYRLPPPDPQFAPAPPGYLFVVGNHYFHKDVAPAVAALAAADPSRTVVVLAGEGEGERPVDEGRFAPRGLAPARNVVRLAAGRLTAAEMSALYAGAAVVVVPSHYEGFGIPVLNALAARRPVFVRPLPVFEELWDALGGDANLHVVDGLPALVEALRSPPPWREEGASRGRPGDAARAADDIGRALDQAIARVDYARIVRRLQDVRGDLAQGPAQITPREFVVREAGRTAERAAGAVLAIPGALRAARLVARSVRGLGRGFAGPGSRPPRPRA